MIAAKVANMRLGDNEDKNEGAQICAPSISQNRAAKMLNVGRRSKELN
jgi:hypothetical protein